MGVEEAELVSREVLELMNLLQVVSFHFCLSFAAYLFVCSDIFNHTVQSISQ
jgi:hypothetical protein